MQYESLDQSETLILDIDVNREEVTIRNIGNSNLTLIFNELNQYDIRKRQILPVGQSCTIDSNYKNKVWVIGKGKIEVIY